MNLVTLAIWLMILGALVAIFGKFLTKVQKNINLPG